MTNFDTIRAALNTCIGLDKALTALSELEAMAGEQEFSLAFYKRRCDALQKWQSKMRDPERTVVCDILANGCTLEPAGNRYAAPVAQQPQCVCGQPTSLGVVHRTDGPCFVYEPAQQPQAEAAPMSQPNRLIAYSAAAKLRELGYQWDEEAEAWAPQQAEAVPPGYVLVPVDVLTAASESLGSFVSDQGWTTLDLQAMDNLDAILAQQKGGV